MSEISNVTYSTIPSCPQQFRESSKALAAPVRTSDWFRHYSMYPYLHQSAQIIYQKIRF